VVDVSTFAILSTIATVLLGGGAGIFASKAGWLKSLGGGFLDRALSSIDKYVEGQTDRERIKAGVVQSYYENRASWMKAGGFILLMLFAIPTAVHYGAVTLYSLIWCADCAYPQDWTIAALPGKMAEWEEWIILACIGGAGAFAWKR
jgi:hypothetical protein